MLVKIINKGRGKTPEYKTKGSAGADLESNETLMVESGETKLVRTGLFMEIPIGYEGQVRPRSGLSLNTGLVAVLGTIDSDYRGEVGVILQNNSKESKTVCIGDRIAQIVFNKVEQADWSIVKELSETERGQGGFGSTGIK